MKRYVAAYARRPGIKPRPGVTSKARATLRRLALRDFRQHVGARWLVPALSYLGWPLKPAKVDRQPSRQTIRNVVRHLQRGPQRGWA